MTSQRALKALTLRLEPDQFRSLALAAAADNRSPTNYVETLVRRDLEAKSEAARVLAVYAAPEVAGVDPGALVRNNEESDGRFAERRAVFDELLSLPDPE